ncbi:MAG: TadG family pilus assembly protein [Tepidisphaeraceae bacterium]
MRNLIHHRRGGRRGATLALLVFLMVMFTAIATLAVDFGHIQLVKSEMQRMADATARGYMEYYITNGQSYANAHGPALYSTTNNPVDGNSGVAPTVNVTWGYWTPSTSTFSTSSGTVPAVQVTVTRTASGGNAVPLFWGGMIGFVSADVHATAVAAEMGGQSGSLSIPSTASPYLAGMPSGSSTTGGDNTSNATPYQTTSIPVTPGTWISFGNFSGTTTVSPGGTAYVGAGGNTSYAVHHGQSWNNAPDNAGPENGIADAVMYEDTMMGLFLTNNAPDQSAAPSGAVDWTQSSQGNQPTYSNLQVQAPFMIGTGATTSGATKRFLVPPGATRLFLSIWDGYQYYNNAGTLTGTVTADYYVELVQ